MLEASHPDALEIDKAKKMLKVYIDLIKELSSYRVNSFAVTLLL